MQHLDLNSFQDFNDQDIARRVLIDDPCMRAVLVSLRAGQGLPDHPSPGPVTVYTLSGRVLFHEGDAASDMVPGSLIRLTPGRLHRVQAQEDSRLLVTMIKPPDDAAWNSLAPSGRDVDLRRTPHERRHGIVFWAFDALSVGESFFLVNDHDPAPLRMQMDVLYPKAVGWEYVQQGPYEFRIKITRLAETPKRQSDTYLARPVA